MDYKVPADWKVYGSSDNSVTFILPGHTPLAPRLAIFDRRPPTVSAGGISVPTYRVRIIEGSVGTDGNPIPTRITVDANIRWPNSASPVKVMANIAMLGQVFTDPDFGQDAAEEQLLPREVRAA